MFVMETAAHSLDADVMLAKGGCKDAFGRLAGTLESYLMTIARKKLGKRMLSRVAPEDIVQQSMLDNFEKIGRFRGDTFLDFKRWMSQSVRNDVHSACQVHMAMKRDLRMVVRGNDLFPHMENSIAEDALESLVKLESFQEVAEVMTRLPETQSEAIRLHHLEGLTYEEIALRMGKGVEAVKGLVKRGVRTLREVLA